jgi:hypothetical protein
MTSIEKLVIKIINAIIHPYCSNGGQIIKIGFVYQLIVNNELIDCIY